MWRLKAVRHKVHPQCGNLEEFQFKRREYEKTLRKARKDQQLVSKRLLQEESDHEGMEIAAEVLSKKKVVQLFRGIQQSGEERVNALRNFRRALRHKETQHIFVKLENSMHLLVGLFSGSNAVWQLEAAHCLHELSHSDEPSIALACLPATPYLLTYLSGQSAKFTYQYLLSSPMHEKIMVADDSLIIYEYPVHTKCITSHLSAVFLLSGDERNWLGRYKDLPSLILRSVLESGVTSHLLRLLKSDSEFGIGAVIECAWCLHYIISSNANTNLLMVQGAVSKCTSLLVALGGAVASGTATEGMDLVISPVLRCLGNLLANHGMESCREQMRDSRVLVALCAFIQGFLQQHPSVARESLWVINNLTADDPVFCSAVFYLNLVPVFMQLLPFSKGINIMVLRLLCNIAEKGPVYCQQLQQREIFSALHATLRMAEPEVVRLSLELLHIIVASIPQVADEFTEKGISALEAIQYNSDEEIRLRASYILDRYLHKHSQVNTPAV
ncbi:transmembrane and coiled-coil domain-containing protein 6-like [Huso huso]|uniref:Transmembrane and coiled-coil domain-containing protein 6-like n=1 Tax=Huso huso TaxID=61971 RepID=A0ABR0YQ32_HUSHU